MIGSTRGPYRRIAGLGVGGMGKVWRAEVTRNAAGLDAGAAVALQGVHAHLLADVPLHREIAAAAKEEGIP
jgi:hypothetical protein